jgi:hypothetical protein
MHRVYGCNQESNGKIQLDLDGSSLTDACNANATRVGETSTLEMNVVEEDSQRKMKTTIMMQAKQADFVIEPSSPLGYESGLIRPGTILDLIFYLPLLEEPAEYNVSLPFAIRSGYILACCECVPKYL